MLVGRENEKKRLRDLLETDKSEFVAEDCLCKLQLRRWKLTQKSKGRHLFIFSRGEKHIWESLSRLFLIIEALIIKDFERRMIYGN